MANYWDPHITIWLLVLSDISPIIAHLLYHLGYRKNTIWVIFWGWIISCLGRELPLALEGLSPLSPISSVPVWWMRRERASTAVSYNQSTSASSDAFISSTTSTEPRRSCSRLTRPANRSATPPGHAQYWCHCLARIIRWVSYTARRMRRPAAATVAAAAAAAAENTLSTRWRKTLTSETRRTVLKAVNHRRCGLFSHRPSNEKVWYDGMKMGCSLPSEVGYREGLCLSIENCRSYYPCKWRNLVYFRIILSFYAWRAKHRGKGKN